MLLRPLSLLVDCAVSLVAHLAQNPYPRDVRFTPESGHVQCTRMSAMGQKRTLQHLYSINSSPHCWRAKAKIF
jgi:hypothetical protein